MSPKELLYIEDALGHAQYLSTQCETAAAQLRDTALQTQVRQLAESNKALFKRFYNLV